MRRRIAPIQRVSNTGDYVNYPLCPEGLLSMAGNPVTYGKTYNLSGGESVTSRELAELMLERRGLRKPMISLPAPACAVAAHIWGTLNRQPLLMEHTVAGLTQDADLNPSLAMQDLGYKPIGVHEGMRRPPSAR
jgi:nucleoside-diphosphate-sugar epimerase